MHELDSAAFRILVRDRADIVGPVVIPTPEHNLTLYGLPKTDLLLSCSHLFVFNEPGLAPLGLVLHLNPRRGRSKWRVQEVSKSRLYHVFCLDLVVNFLLVIYFCTGASMN